MKTELLCKNCKHFESYTGGKTKIDFDICFGKSDGADLVRGGQIRPRLNAYVQRKDPEACGPDACWFKPKRASILRKLFGLGVKDD